MTGGGVGAGAGIALAIGAGLSAAAGWASGWPGRRRTRFLEQLQPIYFPFGFTGGLSWFGASGIPCLPSGSGGIALICLPFLSK